MANASITTLTNRSMQIKTLSGVPLEQILTVFNTAFFDYLVPLQLTPEQLETKMKADGTELSLSCGVFEDEKPVAFISHGMDSIKGQKIVYNGGTGVVPHKRGAGLTTKMYDFILPILRSKGIKKVVLEVISNNVPAIKSYQRIGFETQRELLCYKGDKLTISSKNTASIKPLETYDWRLMESFGDTKPTWQNSQRALSTVSSTNIALGAYLKGQLVGYVIFTPGSKRIQQIAVKPEYRRLGIASQLLESIVHQHGNSLSVINIDAKAKDLNSFFHKIGFALQLKQFEMELLL
ncbi:MAG: GNAT family N-acetyltransferase [Bacteroidota bacterium]